MTRTLLLLAAGIAVGALIAKQNKPEVAPDPVDLIIEKSKQTMQQASQVSARADQAVASKITEMKQTIEVLAEEKEMLVEQGKVMEDDIVTIKSATVRPLNVLAIGVPDTTSGEKRHCCRNETNTSGRYEQAIPGYRRNNKSIR